MFKIQVKKRKNGRRKDLVIRGTGNLQTTSSLAKFIFTLDLKSFSNLKTVCLHASVFRMVCYRCPGMGIYRDNLSAKVIGDNLSIIVIAQNSFDLSITDIALVIYFVIADKLSR